MSKDLNPEFMKKAIKLSRRASIEEKSGGVFGAVVVKDGDFADIDILDEVRKEPKHRRISTTEHMRPEAVEVWKEFANLKDRARY